MTCSDIGADGGHDCNWVEDPPHELICLICLCIAKYPRQHGEGGCGKLFCYSCVEEHKQRNELCPNCRCLFIVHKDVRSYKQVQGLQVKCSNVVNGCRWTGSLSALQNHLLEECRKVYIFCPKGCSNNSKFVKVLRKNMQRHLEYRCPKREQPDVVPIPYYRQRSFSDSQSEQELEKQQPGHLQESSLSDSSVSVEESTLFLKSEQELTLVFPDSIETEDLCKSEENPGHAHPPFFPLPYQNILTNYPLPFVTQCDNFKLIKAPVGPSVLRWSESVVSDCTYLIKAGSSGGKVPLSTWIKDVAIPIQMWRLCVGLIQFEMRCFQFNDEAFSKILMDDEGIAHIPDDMIHSKTTESDSCFILMVAESVRMFLNLPRIQLERKPIEVSKMMVFVNTFEKCADNFHDVLLQLGTIKYTTEAALYGGTHHA